MVILVVRNQEKASKGAGRAACLLRAPRGCPDQSEAGPDFVPGLPHVFILIELRRALISYQDYRMFLS